MPDAFLVTYGLQRHFGPFVAEGGLPLSRGDAVVLRTHRGVELGTVLCAIAPEADDECSTGQVLRLATDDDLGRFAFLSAEASAAVATAERLVKEQGLDLQVLDVEAVAEPKRLLVHALHGEVDVRPFVSKLSTTYESFVEVVNLAARHDHGGCGSCGQGGCCSTGANNGCGSTCGAPLAKDANGEPAWIEFFAELRLKMDRRQAGA